ncbi:DUF551 domain-containing protein [Klebsiella aerogenes]|nr:DUF551 domain-containing protein [Klebsiella aerogenes]
MYVMGMGQALDAETASTCKGAVDSWVAEWNQSRLPGQAEYKTVPLYRHAHPAPVALKDHQMRELVNQLRDTAIQYHGTQQLREQIARVIRAAMLQSEPVTTANKLGKSPVIQDTWIPVSERMPEDGQHIIIFCDGAFVLFAQCRDSEFFDIVRDREEFFETTSRCVTHWMPLPAAPQEVK